MNSLVFDMEANGLNPDKLHCLSYNNLDKRSVKTEVSYLGMKNILANADRLIGHNITRFDIPVLERLLGIEIKAQLIDTLALSWYLFPNRVRHGLEWWGVEFGVPKPPIVDWDALPLEEYINRCEEDVNINTILWDNCWSYLMLLYDNDEDAAWRIVNYLQFKMDCAREQERSGWKLDVERCTTELNNMTKEHDEMYKALKSEMPNVPIKKKAERPAKPFKKDGSHSVTGERWFARLEEMSLPKDYRGTVEYIDGYKEANPSSHDQVKSWLFSLGWDPISFKYVRNDGGFDAGMRKIPQVRVDGPEGKILCPSVLDLVEKAPAIKKLEGITVLAHRMSLLKGFLESVDDDGYISAAIQGLANTLRFKHKTVVNLPGVGRPYGDIVRGCLIAPEGWELMGADMSSLEDRTKQHFIYEHDPAYVEEMNTPGFDPHLDIAVLAGLLTQTQVDLHKSGERKENGIRHKAKTTNYACTYGAKPPRIAREAKIPLREAEALVDTYWERNWAINKVAESLQVKTVNGQKWLFNPVSKFWYSLRNEKDRFSTLNQGTATFIFDSWVREVRRERPQLTAQFHDEIVCCIRKGFRDKGASLLQDAVQRVNDRLKLNRDMAVDVQFGKDYSEIH